MVFKLPLWIRLRPKNLILAVLFALSFASASNGSQEPLSDARTLLSDAQKFYHTGQYFKAARYAFSAGEADKALEAPANAWITSGLVRAGLYNSASYFFIRTLQSGDKSAIRKALEQAEVLLVNVGGDVLRKYMIRHTTYEDYDQLNRSSYLYILAKDAILKGAEERAIGYINGMSEKSALWSSGLMLRASAYAIMGRGAEAISDFKACVRRANNEDLKGRCQAGEARVLYQLNRLHEADLAYDRIDKSSLVWPDILFEQAWNSFGLEEYNRTLGKLASYKSPALSFVFNSEIDVLRAQSFLALCLYSDANDAINEFNSRYAGLGEEVKRFVESNKNNLQSFYDVGKQSLGGPLHADTAFKSLMNRFVRGPYFQALVATEGKFASEARAIAVFDSMQAGVPHARWRGFPGFLTLVLKWRLKSVKLLGGAFIKNSLMDYHSALISDFEKMAFIKLEMLGRAKHRLVYKRPSEGERSRGNVIPIRRDDQYYWSFNGEFWNDELGDYVFGLESECGKT